MPRLELFLFRYRDPRTGKWVRACYRAEQHEIAGRYAEWEITGPAEIRDVDPNARYFTPHKSPLDITLFRYNERPPELQPHSTPSKRSSFSCSCVDTSRTARGVGDMLR